MATFYSVEVESLYRTTPEALVVTLKPNTSDVDKFRFTQGQYLTFRQAVDGFEVRRSYSICSAVHEKKLQVGIKHVPGGVFSSWAHEQLKVGDSLEVMLPMGRFFTELSPDTARTYVGFAGGSGITPLLSLIKTILHLEPRSRFSLVYANQRPATIMFREELEDLKNQYFERFMISHILESEGQEVDLLTGRVDKHKCEQLFSILPPAKQIHAAFICGPEPMMLEIAAGLELQGMDKSRIKYELFTSPDARKQSRRQVNADSAVAQQSIMITLDGSSRRIHLSDPQQTALEAALNADLDAPYACKAGICSTCRARVLSGEVEMLKNHALDDKEVQQGYVLTCQCLALSQDVHLSYDE